MRPLRSKTPYYLRLCSLIFAHSVLAFCFIVSCSFFPLCALLLALSRSLTSGLRFAIFARAGESRASSPPLFSETHSTNHSNHRRSTRALTTSRPASRAARQSTTSASYPGDLAPPFPLPPPCLARRRMLQVNTPLQSPSSGPAIETSGLAVCDRHARSFP